MKGRQGHRSAPSARGKGCSSTFTLKHRTTPLSALHPPPSWSSRAQLCPFPEQEEDGGVSQQSRTSQPAGMSAASTGTFKDWAERKTTEEKNTQTSSGQAITKDHQVPLLKWKNSNLKTFFRANPKENLLGFHFRSFCAATKTSASYISEWNGSAKWNLEQFCFKLRQKGLEL